MVMNRHTMNKYILFAAVAIASVVVAACEKSVLHEGENGDGNVTLHFSAYQQESFTRSSSALTDQCEKLSVTIFKADGSKAKSITQRCDAVDFGTVNVTLTSGSYRIVAIAHNGLGTATISSPEKVTFTNNKVTDTFAYCGTLDVGDEPLERTLDMTRRVAMIRLTIGGDGLPEWINRLKFYYTGGSSTYNPLTGFGCVQSKQTEYRDCEDDNGQPVRVFEIYTLPHSETDAIKKLTITAISADDDELEEQVFQNIPLERNKITTWTGALFGESGTISSGGITLTLDTGWAGTLSYSF